MRIELISHRFNSFLCIKGIHNLLKNGVFLKVLNTLISNNFSIGAMQPIAVCLVIIETLTCLIKPRLLTSFVFLTCKCYNILAEFRFL